MEMGGEGADVFDTVTASLQGLFPRTAKNRELVDDTVVITLLGDYQYISCSTCPGRCSLIRLRYSPFISLAVEAAGNYNYPSSLFDGDF